MSPTKKEPQEVVGSPGGEPVSVEIEEDEPTRAEVAAKKVTATAEDAEAALRSEGQRAINLIWEQTQMKVALSVIWSALLVAAVLGTMGKWLGSGDLQLAAIVFLFGVANLVTGFYFGRTNHQRTGGVGGGNVEASR